MFFITVYPCTQSSQPGQSTPQGSLNIQTELGKTPLNLDDLPNGSSGHWYIPLDPQSGSGSNSENLLSLDGFHLHCPTTFIGATSTTTTFLPLNGKLVFSGFQNFAIAVLETNFIHSP